MYVYGVTRPGALPGVEGVGAAPLRALAHRKLVALASDLPAADVRATRRDLLRHAEVLREAAELATVLPLRFGTVFADDVDAIARLLEPRHDELTRLLRSFDGLVELTVRALYREEPVLAEIVREDARVAALRRRTGGRRADAVALGEAVAHAFVAKRAADADRIVSALQPLARDVVVEEPRTEYEVVRAAFLVERKRLARFDAVADELARSRAEAVVFKYVGPLPPHSFVDLRAA